MSFVKSLHVAASAMSAQRQRMNTITSNLANAETTKTADGGPYRRRDPVFEPKSFEDALTSNVAAQGVEVTGIREDASEPRMVYDPDASDDGFVAMPNVNVVQEMVDMVSASRSYEAATAAVKTAKSMANAALEIGS